MRGQRMACQLAQTPTFALQSCTKSQGIFAELKLKGEKGLGAHFLISCKGEPLEGPLLSLAPMWLNTQTF